MRDMIQPPNADAVLPTVSPSGFLSEVAQFRETVADPAVPATEKARAYSDIVRHATRLDPLERGFEWAGVALKEALCLWLDARPAPARH